MIPCCTPTLLQTSPGSQLDVVLVNGYERGFTLRGFSSEVEIGADDANGLDQASAAQCQHIRAVAAGRIERTRGNVGPTVLVQVRELLGLILDAPR